MEGTPRLYETLVQVLRQHQNWVDLRHLMSPWTQPLQGILGSLVDRGP